MSSEIKDADQLRSYCIADLCLCFYISKKKVFSSPEPLGSQDELIIYACSDVHLSVRRPFTISNISETAWPIKVKFYVEPPWEGGMKVYINGPGHMTKMADMPIYGKNLKKSSFPEPEVL